MANRRNQLLAFTSTPGGGTIVITGGMLVQPIGIGYAAGAIGRTVPVSAAASGIGYSTGAVLRSRQVSPLAAIGIGYSTGEAPSIILLNQSYIPKSTGIGSSSGSLRKTVRVTPAAGVRGVGYATGAIARTKTILSSGIVAGTKGVGYSTGTLYPINNISDVIIATRPHSGIGYSTGTLNVNVFVSGAAQGQGRAGAPARLSKTILINAAALVQPTGRGNSTGAILRSRQVNPTAVSGIGYATGQVSIGGLKILVPVAATGIGYSTGAIRRTIRATPAAGIRGVGYSVGAVTKFRELRLVFASFVQPKGVGNATGDIDRRIVLNPSPPGEVPLATGVGTAATVVSGVGLRIFVRINVIPLTKGQGNATGAIRRTIRLTPVAPVGIGYAVGQAIKGGQKIVVPNAATGIGYVSGTLLIKHQLPNAAAVGIGYAVGAIATGGAVVIWSPAFNTGYITQFDPAWFHPSTVHTYTALMKCTGGTMVKSRLFNVSDNVPVSGTEVSVTPTSTPMEATSAPIALGAWGAGEKNYRAEVGTLGGAVGVIYRARIASKDS